MEQKTIKTRLGTQAISTDKVIHFPKGLIGFEKEKDFVLLQMRPDLPFLTLQSVASPEVGLIVTDPYSFYPEYQIELGSLEQKLLKIDKREDLTVLVTVSIPTAQPEKSFMNMAGPILINHDAKIGLQVPQNNAEQPSQMFIKPA